MEEKDLGEDILEGKKTRRYREKMILSGVDGGSRRGEMTDEDAVFNGRSKTPR